jgi:[acyl-carrier-protein] S-malonyltransferase
MLKEFSQQYSVINETFAEASQALGIDLWEISQQGPEDLLNQTIHTQPILLTAGVALWRAWVANNGALPAHLAGHSLGEYTALVCANALGLQDGVKLVALRGKLMQEAVPLGTGAMAAVIGLDDNILQEICVQSAMGEVVSPVNFNAIGQTVIAGNSSAVERASISAKGKGAKRVIPLPVSVPSHCDLMRPAAQRLSEYLTQVKILSPKIAVLHNVDVVSCQHPDDIRERLVQQLYKPVRWVETIQALSRDGVQTIVECGPGKVLAGLIKRIEPLIKTWSIENPKDFAEAVELCEKE